jgi:hypothetical protein
MPASRPAQDRRETAWEELLRLRAEEDARVERERQRKAALLAGRRRRQRAVDIEMARARHILRHLPPDPAAVTACRRLILDGVDNATVPQMAAAILADLPPDPDAARHRRDLLAALAGQPSAPTPTDTPTAGPGDPLARTIITA